MEQISSSEVQRLSLSEGAKGPSGSFFLVTIGILAAIYGFPYIVMALGLILVSPWFWMTIGGLVVLIIYPPAVLWLGLIYVIVIAINWHNGRLRDQADIQQMLAALEADKRRFHPPVEKLANVLSCRDYGTEEPKALYSSNWRKAPRGVPRTEGTWSFLREPVVTPPTIAPIVTAPTTVPSVKDQWGRELLR